MSKLVKMVSTGLLTIAVLAGSVTAAGCTTSSSGATSAQESQTTASSEPTAVDNNQIEAPTNLNQVSSAQQSATLPTSGSTDNNTIQGAGPGQMPGFNNQLTQVAATLGIDEQKLQDAISQARSELGQTMRLQVEL